MKIRVLCVCEGGNTRSVSLAHILKDLGYDALSCGCRDNSRETLDLLANWADKIVVLQEGIKGSVAKEFLGKVEVCDVGPDIWYNPCNEDLVRILQSKTKSLLR